MFGSRSFVVLALLLSACATAPRPPATPAPAPLVATPAPAPLVESEQAEVLAVARLAAVGDILMHGAVKESAAAAARTGPEGESLNHEGYDDLFEAVAEALGEADLAFANLETPIAPTADRGSRPFVFNAPAALIPALQEAGIGLVSFANNHSYDQGVAGMVETVERLEAAGLPQIGAGPDCESARRPRILEVAGIRIGFVAATGLFNTDGNAGPAAPCVFRFDERQALQAAEQARAEGAELVILSMHWGVEYSVQPRQAEIALAHRLLDGGYDAILGHHPHVLQPVEVYETRDGRLTFVAYSLGNFISNQSRTYVYGVQPDHVGNTRDGLILRFAAVRKRWPDGTERVQLAELRAEPLWTDNNALERRRDKSASAYIRVVHLDRALDQARAALAEATGEDERQALYERIELLEARRAITARIIGEEILP